MFSGPVGRNGIQETGPFEVQNILFQEGNGIEKTAIFKAPTKGNWEVRHELRSVVSESALLS